MKHIVVSRKIAIFLVFVMGITLVILGGVYNPYTEVINLPQGGFRGIGFKMYGGEVATYHLQSFHTFTIYIMNKVEFDKLMNNGTFNSSYYTFTGKSVNIEFHAPVTDVYYIVVANFNSEMGIEVDFSYQKEINWPLTVAGSIIVGISLIFVFIEVRNSKRAPKLDAICPECGNKVSTRWNYCPYCRHQLRREK